MKSKFRLIISSLIIFIVSVIFSVCGYFALHLSQEFSLKNINKIIVEVGLISGIVTTVIYLLITLCIRTVKDNGFRSFLIVVLMVFYLAFVCILTLNMVFYQLDNPNSFVKYFMEL
ncbi:hypothetical protein [Chryseobacterium sp.]|uniref:hypothetical protein n=1 Tax=Chryseobacterium sp. TaxID=1871047 RepID=UPI00289CC728|nr:hypothetical protein [Chryseobacterium sp.]